MIVAIYSMIFILGPEVCSTLFDMLKTCSESPSMVSHLAKGIFSYTVQLYLRKKKTIALHFKITTR